MRIMFDKAQHGYRASGMRDYRAGLLLNGDISEDAVPAAAIFVNVFDGGPNTLVEFVVDGRKPQAMTRVYLKDPFLNELAIRHADSRKSWVAPVPSTHLWTADLPDDLQAGTYTVSVTAVDEFGRSHHAHRILEITGTSATATGGTHFR